MVMSSSSAAFFAENFAGTVSVFVGAPGTAKAPLTNPAFAGGLAFDGGCFWAAGASRPNPAFCLSSSEPSNCWSTGLMLITTNSMTSRRSFAAAKRAMGSSRCALLGQEPAISCAKAADFCRSASKPARCCSCAAGAIARMIGSAVAPTRSPPGARPPLDPSLPGSPAGPRCKPRRFQLLASQAQPQFIGQRIVEGLEWQANCEERVVHRPDSILDRLEPLRDGRGHGGGTSGCDAL